MTDTPLPRYGPAVLRALAAWYAAIVPYEAILRITDDSDFDEDAFDAASRAYTAAEEALLAALDADTPAVPALPDEGERDASPHRFAHPHGGPL